MVRSMTGFGRGEYLGKIYSFNVEIKAVNHRYNEISVRMPRYLNFLEDKIKKEVKKDISRGRVDIYINLEYMDDSSLNIDVDLPLAKESMNVLEVIKNELNIEDNIKISDLMNVSDIITIERKINDEEELWQCLEKALEMAINDVISMKIAEGKALKEDMLNRLDIIGGILEKIKTRSPLVIKEYKGKLRERIEDLLDDDVELEDERLNQEIVIFADKSDINEEIIRLESHIYQFKEIVKEDGSVGRKLDFLIQELNREANTIGSKSGDIEITQAVVEIKSEIEKIREQVQNIE